MKPTFISDQPVSDAAMIELLLEVAKAFANMEFEGGKDESDLSDLSC